MGEAELGDAMGVKYYDPAVWHRDTWKFRRAEREFQIEIAERALQDVLEDEARIRQFSHMVSTAQNSEKVEHPLLPEVEEGEEGGEEDDGYTPEEKEAAVRIQCAGRGMLARKRVKAIQQSNIDRGQCLTNFSSNVSFKVPKNTAVPSAEGSVAGDEADTPEATEEAKPEATEE
eukprot:CAMPEP_0118929576 /NCGR_PEP_ID=MMETSP1169-20130426/6531_1 /TAXON_ID=36882 /ORGANISM="Pyramimonas obovata, Strain CCMP722" /LENGTH=173 /DNA_ID=CAMNT_0006871791 /DNA_START=167 /DNA_END=685 /DNA_ORIENTATION=+